LKIVVIRKFPNGKERAAESPAERLNVSIMEAD